MSRFTIDSAATDGDPVAQTLMDVAGVLGMFEAYSAFAAQYMDYEAIAPSDKSTISVLEAIYLLGEDFFADIDGETGHAHTAGYSTIVKIHLDNRTPDLDAIRALATSVVTHAFNSDMIPDLDTIRTHPGLLNEDKAPDLKTMRPQTSSAFLGTLEFVYPDEDVMINDVFSQDASETSGLEI